MSTTLTRNATVFSRDCPEFELRTPGRRRLVVLVNHLKSKGFGSQAANNSGGGGRRKVADIYARLRARGWLHRGPGRLQRPSRV